MLLGPQQSPIRHCSCLPVLWILMQLTAASRLALQQPLAVAPGVSWSNYASKMISGRPDEQACPRHFLQKASESAQAFNRCSGWPPSFGLATALLAHTSRSFAWHPVSPRPLKSNHLSSMQSAASRIAWTSQMPCERDGFATTRGVKNLLLVTRHERNFTAAILPFRLP